MTNNKADVDRLLDLALLQGNRFIKELLRAKQLPIGTNKEQFEAHLREAISSGQLTNEDLRAWLSEVEGWGDQHAYLYMVPRNQRDAFRDRKVLAAQLKAGGYAKYLDAELPGKPNEELTLATVRHSVDGVSFIWVQGNPTLMRRSKHDFDEIIDGEDIHFQAYERRWTRHAARFEWRFASDLAGVFGDASVPPADVVAHSFGSWIVAHALQAQPELRLGRIVLVGSIVRPNWDWGMPLARGQIQAVLNYCGDRDLPVKITERGIPDSGPSGVHGFTSADPRVINILRPGGRHSTAFEEGVLASTFEDVWQPFLANRLEDADLREHRRMKPAEWKPAHRLLRTPL